MNWLTYKTLGVKQKEEYNYRFKEPIQSPNLLVPIIIMYAFMVIFLFTSYLIIKAPELEIQKDNITQLIYGSSVISLVTTFWCIYLMIEYLVRAFIKTYQYSKWKKENNIKEVFWYSKWLK